MPGEILRQQGSPEIAAIMIGVAVLATVAACAIVAYVQLACRHEKLRDYAAYLEAQMRDLNNRVALIYYARPELDPIDAEEGAHVEWPADME